MVRVTRPRIEQGYPSLGTGVRRPRLSWELQGAVAAQTAYEVRLAYVNGSTIHSGRIQDADGVLRPWPGDDLRSRQRVEVAVRVWTDLGISDWSEPATVEAGLLERSDWVVGLQSPSLRAAHAIESRPAYLLRARFVVPHERVARMRLYVSAHGVYELEVNGRRVGDEELAPGWTSYDDRLRYRTIDLADYLQGGENTLGFWLADGWYRGRLGFNGGRWDNYGEDIGILAQLEVTYENGVVDRLEPCREWEWRYSPITSAGLYEGEVYDEQLLDPDWSLNTGASDAWGSTVDVGLPAAELVAPQGPPVRVTETLAPISVERRSNGRLRLDFGQNVTGRLRISVPAGVGKEIRLHHAEVLENDELATRPLRGAPSVDVYRTDPAGGTASWAPRFTFHGFRYAELEGWNADFLPEYVVAEVMHSDMERSGWFSSSHAGLNALHDNVIWSMRDNFLDLPTDCPQRDERLGWTGDIQVFAPTAQFLYRSAGVLTSWLDDLRVEQAKLGTVPNFVPWIECGFPFAPTAAWGDAAVIVPWTIYQRTGDQEILARQFDSMYAWVQQVASLTEGTGLWSEGFQLGDWLDPAAPPEAPDAAQTDRYLVSTAYHAHSSRIVAEVAELLGLRAEAEQARLIWGRAVRAFQREFVAPSGRLVSDSATAYSLAIVFDLLEMPGQRERAGERLAELVESNGYRIQTGFVGTPLICDALAATGHHDVVYHLLLQTELPSWLYPVSMGATTIWERWDSMLPDGSINPGEMTSFNHYSLGAVADYLHRVVAGISPDGPAYRRTRIQPRPGGGLTHASAAHFSPYGRIAVEWSREGEMLTVAAEVPAGVAAVIDLPNLSSFEVGSGRHEWSVPYRAAESDPPPKRVVNIHNPEEAAAELALEH